MLALEMLTEPVVVPDIYVSGLAAVEDMGDGNFRLTCYTRQVSIYGGYEYVVASRVITTMPAMLDGVRQVMIASGKRCCGALSGRLAMH